MPGPTMKAIADACGVSRSTVSLALGGHGHRLAPDTLEKVLATAKRLGYRPNQGALAIRTGRFGAIALLRHTSCYLPDQLLHGLTTACADLDLHLVLSDHPDEEILAPADQQPKLLRQAMIDGILVNRTPTPSQAIRDQIEAIGLPVRWLNQYIPGGIRPDDAGAGAAITDYLIARGHRRIACSGLIGGDNEHPSMAQRMAGYQQAMQAAGLPTMVLHADGISPADQRVPAAIQALREHRPTALVLISDRAFPVFVMAAQHCQLQVPADLSLASFNEGGHIENLGLQPGGAALPWAALAHQAVRSVNGGPDEDRSDELVIPYPAVVAGSTIADA